MNSAGIATLNEQERRIYEKLRREFGRTICELLESTDVVEIMLNSDGALWVERHGAAMAQVGTMEPNQAESIMATIASFYRTTITRETPILECEVPFDGSRFQGLISPIVTAPTFAIRRKASSIFTLDDYVRTGIMTDAQGAVIKGAIEGHKNILVGGGTGSGKTTLVNAMLDHVAQKFPNERLVIIEDTAELQCRAPNHVILRATDTVDMLRLLKTTLRLYPKRIIVGEVRGLEALALLKAWNTGHPGGLGTLHCDSAPRALLRLEELVSEASITPRHQTIAQTVNFVVFIEKTDEGRRVSEVVSVQGHDGVTYITKREA